MEPAILRDGGVRGEETLATLLVARSVGLLMLQSQSEEWFRVADWGFLLTACCLVLQVVAIYNFPLRKKDIQTGFVFRHGVVNGIYCTLLVPLAVLAQVLHESTQAEEGHGVDLSEVALLMTITCGMLLMAPATLKRMMGILYLLQVFSSAIMVLLLKVHLGSDVIPWLTGFVVVMCLVYYLPYMCPFSFTFGELSIVCHVLGAVVFRMTRWMSKCIFDEEWPVVTHEVYIYIFISVTLLFVILASTLVLYWDWCDNIVPFVLVYVACGLMAIAVIMFLTGHQPILWLFWFIFGDHRRISLLAWWFAVAGVTVISFSLYTQHVSNSQSGQGSKASTAARKVFHGVVVAVYVPGLVVDPHFLLLASVVALVVLSVLEMSRLINVQWLGPAVENSFQTFVDDRDQGPVLLTHIYLLVGLSLPLWLSHNITVGDVRNYCGVISLGIGDTVACVVGMQYGNTKWPGTKKSVEGTAASVVAQLLFVVLAFYLGWLEGLAWLNTVFAILLSSVFEAFVSQIDNLVLPVFMLAALPSLRI